MNKLLIVILIIIIGLWEIKLIFLVIIEMIEFCKKIFEITEDDVKSVRKYYKITQKEIDRDCEIIKIWMKQQSHFPDDYDKNRIERILLRNKFRIERTKEKLESYYTLKGEHQTFFQKMDPRNEDMQIGFKTTWIIPLPKLLNNMDRIYIYRFGKNEHLYSLDLNVLLMQALQEIELIHDYAVGIRFILDFENLTMTHIKSANLNMVVKSINIYQECMSGRILSLELINILPMLNIVLSLFKLCFPKKLYKKIKIHKNFESLKRNIPAKYLPREYEGELGSICDIHEDVKDLYMQSEDFLMKRINMISNESKRVSGLRKNELFGVEGTFKKINLD